MSEFLSLVLVSCLGVLLAGFLSLLPALHVYNVAGLMVLIVTSGAVVLPYYLIAPFAISMVVAYAFLSNIPSVYLSAPDEGAIFLLLPGQKYLMLGKGHEAVALASIGSLLAAFLLVVSTPLLLKFVPKFSKIVSPHLPWILALIVLYILISEWPKGLDRFPTKLGRFFEGWKNLLAGQATFWLSGLMGLLVMNGYLLPPERGFQGMMPVFVGLFAVPWILMNLATDVQIPWQHVAKSVDADSGVIFRGLLGGSIGGYFAAIFPLVTAGVGGLLAGHATGERDERAFIFSQGVSKFLYYVGGLFLLFLPGVALTRGGMAWIIRPIYREGGSDVLFSAIGAVLLASGLSFLLVLFFSSVIAKNIYKINYRALSLIVLLIIFALVYGLLGFVGVGILVVASFIGLIPVLFNSRRMNCLGALFVPIILNMAGLSEPVLRFLGLG